MGTFNVKIGNGRKGIPPGEDPQENRFSPKGIINIVLQCAIVSSLLVLFTSKTAIFKIAPLDQFSLNW